MMAQLSPEVKLAVAKKELTLTDALTQAGIPIPEWLRTGASAPAGAPVAPGEVQISATGAGSAAPRSRPASRGRGVATVGGAATRSRGRTADARRIRRSKEAKRAEAQRKLALMQRLPSEREAAGGEGRDHPGGRAARGRHRPRVDR